MKTNIQTLQDVWILNRPGKTSRQEKISFDDLTNSIISTGPFSFYIINFFDMSLSHISDSIYEMHDFNKENLTLNNILESIHPDDISFVSKAEKYLTDLFYEKIGYEKLLDYKLSYNFRLKIKTGEYVLFNHQSLMLTMHEDGALGKSLNIHTRIDHLSNRNTYKISLIGLKDEPSIMNLSLKENDEDFTQFSKREIDIIKLLGSGMSNKEIADKLFISPLTVKKHRNNILTKSECKNTSQLIKKCILNGLI